MDRIVPSRNVLIRSVSPEKRYDDRINMPRMSIPSIKVDRYLRIIVGYMSSLSIWLLDGAVGCDSDLICDLSP
jgi:hypothetical protein